MAVRLKPVDVVTIGVGLTGSLMALELAKTGLKVVGIGRGAPRFTVPDFQSPAIHDELRFSVRKGMMQDNVKEAVTFRNSSDETALPIRRWASFLPGTGLGGSFVHWNGQSFRFQAADFIYKTHIEQRYGKKFFEACGPELTSLPAAVGEFEPALRQPRRPDAPAVRILWILRALRLR